ncbi:MAG TPA: sigma-70 family RNA polymerase sigma factor [Iamia sp.]|jgi:RNA polymerase sigma-70 factor (ECF subfamily)|nr:sigma-70 family RNA polymerase sigma factor [Iamia sp.]
MTTDDVATEGRDARLGFDDVYRSDWHPVVALGWTLTGSRAAGEELAQDAFLDAYRRWDHVGTLDRPGAWVRRAVANRAVSHRRHLRVVEAGSARLATAARVAQDAASSPPATDPAFWAAVRALPERQAQCLALHYLEDMAIDAIAALLDCRASTVRVHLSRGRRTLARTLAPTTSEEDA